MTTALPARCPATVAPLAVRGSAQILTFSMPTTLAFSMTTTLAFSMTIDTGGSHATLGRPRRAADTQFGFVAGFSRRCLQNRPSEVDGAQEPRGAEGEAGAMAGRAVGQRAARLTSAPRASRRGPNRLPISGDIADLGSRRRRPSRTGQGCRRWRARLRHAVAPLGRAASTARQMAAI